MEKLLKYQSTRGRERYHYLYLRAKEKGLIKKGLVWENIFDFFPENEYIFTYHLFQSGLEMGIYKEEEREDFFKLFKTTDADRAFIDAATGYYSLEPGTIARAINASGGVAVLAHPGGLEKYVDEFIACGIKGFEVHHSHISDETVEFFDKLCEIDDATYIFVSLGDDAINLSTAVKIRTACENINYCAGRRKPDIETVIYDTSIRNHMGTKWGTERNAPGEINPDGVANFKDQHYDIHIIGDLDHFYTVDTLMNFELEKTAKTEHCKYYPESTFWKYEYNYRSSLARAMHTKVREKMNLDSAEIEHRRWNAYMRTEGYSYSGSLNKNTRNDLGKLHNDLVSFSMLNADEKKKDD
jgi:hypothetical protein